MTNYEDDKPNGAGNDVNKSELEDSTAVEIDPHDDTKTQLINGGGDDHPEKFKVAIADPGASSSDGEVSFNGMGKDEVLQYANDPFWVRLRWIMFILFWIGWLAMLVTAVAIIVLAPRCPHRPDLKWYHTDNVYQVVAKSFKDSDNDGIGDLKGLKDKIDYIHDDLNTKALLLSSIYPADKDSSGMGVIDHKAVDTEFVDEPGKFKSWVKKMRKEGKKVILDLIPNQTSKKHPWFMKSVKEEGDYKDYYVWVSDSQSAKPPNNWQMVHSSDSAWTYDDTRKAWYLHQFSSSLPDLNLNNSKVVEEIKDIMKYWLDAGVSGFNIRQLEYLVENPENTDDDLTNRNETRNYMGTLSFLEQLRKVADDYSDKPGRERVLFATVHDANQAQIKNYWGTKKNERLHIVAPYLKELGSVCDAQCIKKMVENIISEEIEEEQWLGLQVGDLDRRRIASRLATSAPDNYEFRLLNTHALQLLLPGTPLVYYGDEFGQRDGSGKAPGSYHAPMQWDKTENAGFTGQGVEPYLNISATYAQDNAEVGRVIFKDMTPFVAYQKLTELRGEESFQFGKTKLCTVGDDILMFSRHASRFPHFITLVNMGKNKVTVSPSDLKCLEPEDEAVVSFHSRDESSDEVVDMKDQGVHLEAFDVVVLKFAAKD